jgi:hypothetical protein
MLQASKSFFLLWFLLKSRSKLEMTTEQHPTKHLLFALQNAMLFHFIRFIYSATSYNEVTARNQAACPAVIGMTVLQRPLSPVNPNDLVVRAFLSAGA